MRKNKERNCQNDKKKRSFVRELRSREDKYSTRDHERKKDKSKFTALIRRRSNSAPLFIKLSRQELLTKICQVSALFNFRPNASQHGSFSVRTLAPQCYCSPCLSCILYPIYIHSFIYVKQHHSGTPHSLLGPSVCRRMLRRCEMMYNEHWLIHVLCCGASWSTDDSCYCFSDHRKSLIRIISALYSGFKCETSGDNPPNVSSITTFQEQLVLLFLAIDSWICWYLDSKPLPLSAPLNWYRLE